MVSIKIQVSQPVGEGEKLKLGLEQSSKFKVPLFLRGRGLFFVFSCFKLKIGLLTASSNSGAWRKMKRRVGKKEKDLI